jgi:hypothetical protein
MLLNMVQHPWLRGSLAIKIKRQTIKAAIQLLKYRALARLKVSYDCPKEVKSISSSVASMLVFPRIFVPWKHVHHFTLYRRYAPPLNPRSETIRFVSLYVFQTTLCRAPLMGPLLCLAQ